jgi:hypothetical protein
MPRTQKPVSPAQLAANRANATHSTGPQTPEGNTQAERKYRRALEDFDRLKTLRPVLPNEPLPVAVGTSVTRCPPHRSVRAVFPHTALVSDA